MNSIIVNK